jgi:hypothetical protein
MTDELDPRDGPTPEFANRHDVISRSTGVGKRVRSRLEQLLESRYIAPAQAEAGRRFARDYLICFGGGGRSCLDVSPRGSAGWNHSEAREDASRAYMAARKILDGELLPQAVDVAPSQVLFHCCVNDETWSGLGARLNVTAELARAMVSQYLAVLAHHYEAEDRRRGVTTTAHTLQAALARFDPDAVAAAAG